MKKITFLLLFVVSLGFSQITIGTSNNGGASDSTPLNIYWGYSYTQTIYLASEINSIGNITSLDYQLNAGTDIALSDDMVDVWIGHTTKTQFNSTTDWVDVATLTQVLTSGTITSAGDVLTITFDAPFAYNGTDNLIIAVDGNEPGFAGTGDYMLQTTGPASTSIHYRNDNTNPDPTAPGTATSVKATRGNVTFQGISTLCGPASASASIVEDCDNLEFSILVDVTDLGDSVNLEITNDAGVASTTVTATGEVTVGPFPAGTGVILTLENENNDLCDVAIDSILDLCPTDSSTLDYYNLQFPTGANTSPLGNEYIVYAQAYEDGLTNLTSGQSPGIEVWIGYNLDDTDPSTEVDWTWISADFNVEVGNNDEYFTDLADGLAEGVYYYASRFRLNNGPYTYGGAGGAWNSDSGELTITPPDAPGNDECSAAEMLTVNADLNCTVITSGTTAGATASAEDDAGTSGTPNTDVWYSFVATGPAHTIELSNVVNLGGGTSTSTDMGMTLYDATNGCAGLDFVRTSDPNIFTAIDLIPGTTYYIRVYGWATGVQYNNFDICVGTPDPVTQGSYCSDAIVVGVLPYTDSDDTANYGDDYAGTPGTDCGSANNYLNGDDVIYEYTATSDTSINISLTGIGSTYTGIFAYDNCADLGVMCSTEGDINAGITDDLAFDLTVTNGETYYIVISTWAAPQSTTYTLNITENSCTDATVTYSVVDDCANSGGFNILVDITDVGSSSSIDINDDQGSATQSTAVAGMFTFGPYVNATDVIISITDNDDSNCNQLSVALTQNVCPVSNDECANAIDLDPFANSDGTCTTIYSGSNVGATNSIGEVAPSGACVDGDATPNDVWFTLTVPSSGQFVFEFITNPGFSTIVELYTGTCGALVALDPVVCGNGASRTFTGLTPNETVYLRVWDYGSDDEGVLEVCVNYLNCTPATVTYSVVEDCANSGGFNILVDITDVGSSTSIDINDDQGSASQSTGVAGMFTFGPYVNATDVVISLTDNDDANCSQDSATLTQVVCPPANNECVNAIPVNDGDSIIGSTTGATNVEALTACQLGGGSIATGCAGGTGTNNFGAGIWYVYTAGPDEAISVTTDNSIAPLFDTEIQVFSGDCNNLVCVGGDDDGGVNSALSTFCWESSAAEGTTVDYYIYVDGHLANSGDFTLDISVESTLSIIDFENQNSLTYFPNPVKNELILKAKQNIQNVVVFNMLGQEILRTKPNTLESNLDMSSLNTGSYFVKVTINEVTETIRIIKN